MARAGAPNLAAVAVPVRDFSPNGATTRSNGAPACRSRRILAAMPPPIAVATDGALISVRAVDKRYETHSGTFTALHQITLEIGRGEFVGVVGQSGSGKSTLLNLLSGIDRVTAGEVFVNGVAVHAMRERELARWRGQSVGIVFQFFQLLPTLTAIENVMLPMDLCARWPARERAERGRVLLERLGVADQAHKLPATLSGGQQQRVAIARALANEPAVLLADEPTGNLDSRNAAMILDLFATLANEGQTIIAATHDAGVHRVCTRTVALADGRLAEPVAAYA